MFALIIFAVLVGSVIPIQTAANSQLRHQLNSPFLATIINSSTGACILALLCCLNPEPWNISVETFSSSPWWIWLGGPLGVAVLSSAIIVMPYLGGLYTVLVTMIGSIVTGIIFDTFGLLYVPLHHFTLTRALGLVLVALGFCLVLQLFRRLKKQEKTAPFSFKLILIYLVGLSSGALLTLQVTINSALSVTIQSSIHAAFISMTVTALTTALIIAIRRESFKKLTTIKIGRSFWILSGGACGAFSIAGNSFLLPYLGAGTLVILTISGQLLSGLIIDHFALFNAVKRRAGIIQFVGLLIVMAGVCVIKYLS